MGRKFSLGFPRLLKKYAKSKARNQAKFAELTRKIIGKRTQKAFAESLGYSYSAVSQVLNGKYKNIAAEFLQAIWDNREPNCDVTEEEFLEAAGYSKISEDSQADEFNREYEKRTLEDVQSPENARNIFQNELLRKKFSILETIPNYQLENKLGEKVTVDYLIRTNISEKDTLWAIKVIFNSISKPREFLKDLFALLYVKKSLAETMRYSLVISDRKLLKALKLDYQHIAIDDYVSVILVDFKRQIVVDEFIMARRDEKNNVKSIFTEKE